MLPDLPLARIDSRLDRDAVTRLDPAALGAAQEDPAARVVLASARRIAVVRDGDAVRLDLRDAAPILEGHQILRPASAPTSPQPETVTAYLGRVAGVPMHALLVADEALDDVHGELASLRDVAEALTGTDADLATTATALAAWHGSHPHCPRCGALTQAGDGGWVRVCPADGSQHFPRTDPAVIMAITDHEDRVLLGHAVHFPLRRYSCLAGFVEAGESAEAAVRREVLEEAGVEVGDVTYLASQPWPFPRSLMLGFLGRTREPRPVPRADGHEIGDVRFFSRAELAEAVGSGEVVLPGGASIARAILTHWYGQQLPEGPGDA